MHCVGLSPALFRERPREVGDDRARLSCLFRPCSSKLQLHGWDDARCFVWPTPARGTFEGKLSSQRPPRGWCVVLPLRKRFCLHLFERRIAVTANWLLLRTGRDPQALAQGHEKLIQDGLLTSKARSFLDAKKASVCKP